MKKFDVALIGVGNWGRLLKMYFQRHKRFNLMYICDSKSNLDDVFDNPDVDVVAIATPDDTHADLVLRALENDKHVFCEKPLALDAVSVDEIKELAQEKGKVVFTDYIYTFSKALRYIQDSMQRKAFGSINGIELISRHARREEQGDVRWVLGTHMLSILNMFIPIEHIDFECIDLAYDKLQVETALINFDSITAGNIVISLNYMETERKVIIHCDRGSIIFEPVSGRVNILSRETLKKKECWTFDESENIELVLRAFHECLVGISHHNLDTACLITKKIEEIIDG